MQESVYLICWLMGPELLPGFPDVEPFQLSPLLPVTVQFEMFEMFQKMRVVLPFCTMVGRAWRWPVRLFGLSGTGESRE